MSKEKKKPFWKTIPGIFAGIATVITTLYGVKVALEGLEIIRPKAEVPYVLGIAKSEAVSKIEKAGFTFGGETEEITDNSDDHGKVIKQNPKAGARIAQGESIGIVIAEPAMVDIPIVKDKTLRQALTILRRTGLKGIVKTSRHCDHPPDLVLEQNPKAGRVPKGSNVHLNVVQRRKRIASPPIGGSGSLQTLSPGQRHSQNAWALRGTGIMFGLEGDDCTKGVVTVTHPLGQGNWTYPIKSGQKKDATAFYGVGKLTVFFTTNNPHARLKLRIW